MSRRHKKILPNFCCSERRERRKMIKKKFCRIFVVRPSFIQTSSCYKVYTSVRLSAITLLRASFGALLWLYSAWCTCSASLCMCHLYAPLCSPPPGAVPAPQVTTTISDYWRGYKQGRVGGS